MPICHLVVSSTPHHRLKEPKTKGFRPKFLQPVVRRGIYRRMGIMIIPELSEPEGNVVVVIFSRIKPPARRGWWLLERCP